MSLKVIPFEMRDDSTWRGQFGRLKVTVRPIESGTYWRGPDREVVLRRPRQRYLYTLEGQFTGSAATLEGAFERAEIECYKFYQSPIERPRYSMTECQREAEAEVLRSFYLDTIEADRIAFERGWEISLDTLPSLRSFAENEGLFPFAKEESATLRP